VPARWNPGVGGVVITETTTEGNAWAPNRPADNTLRFTPSPLRFEFPHHSVAYSVASPKDDIQPGRRFLLQF